MAGKIFISYRREESAANALSIAQYLEHEFGRKNVFVDVDMRAGAKFPAVLEERLRECKVMLALMGPKWTTAKDEEGQPRLDNPNDWVRLEIGRALARDINVIPVRVDGADLPKRSMLPTDIQGLLDHQAVTVSTDSFRNDMAGLVRDIRSIPDGARRSRGILVGGLIALTLLGGGIGLYWSNIGGLAQALLAKIEDLFGKDRQKVASFGPDWTLFGVSTSGFAEYMNLASVKQYADRVAITTRYQVDPTKPVANNQMIANAAYEQDIVVFDCKSPRFAFSQQTVFDSSGNSLYNFKWADPDVLDLSIAIKTNPGSVADGVGHLLCDPKLRVPLVTASDLSSMNFSYSSSMIGGNGDIYFRKDEDKSADNNVGLVIVMKFNNDVNTQTLFPNQSPIGLPPTYRYFVERVNLDCSLSQLKTRKFEYYDSANNLRYMVWGESVQPVSINQTSPLGTLKRTVCPPAA